MDKNKLLNSAGKIGVKPFIILILVLLFLIPLRMLDSLVDDRKSYQKDAVRSILEPKGGAPVIEGFVIAVPFKKNGRRMGKRRKTLRAKNKLYRVRTRNMEYAFFRKARIPDARYL